MIKHMFNDVEIICHLDVKIADQENILTIMDKDCDLYLVMEFVNNMCVLKKSARDFTVSIDYEDKIIEIS